VAIPSSTPIASPIETTYKLAANQSEHARRAANRLLDGGMTLGIGDGRYPLWLVEKNLFDKRYATSAGPFSGSGAAALQPGYDRAFAAVFRGQTVTTRRCTR